MTEEDDYHLSSAELTLRVELRVRELLAEHGVPPAEVQAILDAAYRYVRLKAPPPRELERRFLFAVERECRRFREDLRRRVMEGIEAMREEER